MKSEDLLYAVGQIDETYILQAEKSHRYGRLRRRLVAAGACAAALVCLAAAVAHFGRSDVPPLPPITLSEGGGAMGREAYLAPSFAELKIGDPWTPADTLATLPVYDNSTVAARHREGAASPAPLYTADMKRELLEVAEKLGMAVTEAAVKENPYGSGFVVTDETYRVEVNETRVVIESQRKDILPEGYTLYAYGGYDDLQRTAAYLVTAYAALLDMQDPCIDIYYGDYTVDNRQLWNVSVYEKSEDLRQSLINFHFGKVDFSGDDEGNLWMISYSRYADVSVLGEYPLISAKEAERLLCNGRYVSSNPEFPGREYIRQVELVYRNAFWDDVFVPYYKFYVEEPSCLFEGMQSFATYYVPAVESRYITNMPLWDGSLNG